MADDRAQMEADLQTADAAGDTALVKRILKAMNTAPAVGPPTPAAEAPAPAAPAPQRAPWDYGAPPGDQPIDPKDMRLLYRGAEVGPPTPLTPKEAAQKDAFDQTKLRLPDFLGGKDIPFLPQAVSKFMVGNTAQATDKVLAARQGAADFGFGNKEALAKEAKLKAELDAPIHADPAGELGSVGGTMAPEVAAFATGAGPIKHLYDATKTMSFLPRVLARTAPGVTGGAAFGPLQPSSNPEDNIGKKALEGGLWGIPFELGGQTLAKVAHPAMAEASDYAKKTYRDLMSSELGNKISTMAVNMTDNPTIKGATDALSKVFFFGKDINKKVGEHNKAFTEVQTARTGTPMSDVHTDNVNRMWKNLEDTGSKFRAGNDVSVAHIPDYLRDGVESIQKYLTTTGQGALAKKLTSGAAGLEGKASGLLDASGKPIPPKAENLTAGELMDLRKAVSDAAWDMRNDAAAAPVRQQLQEFRKMLDDAFKKANPAPTPRKPHPFDEWREQWGQAEEARKAIDKGIGAGGSIKPGNVELSPRGEGSGAKDAHERMVLAARDRLWNPSEGNNRALATYLLTYGIPAAGVGASAFMDNPIPGALGMSTPFIAKALLSTHGGGKYLTSNSEGQKILADMLRKAGQFGGATFGQTRDRK